MRELFLLASSSLIVTLVIVSLTSVTNLGYAQVMSSTNYQIQSDSVNFGGGFSSSTNYQLESTGGEIATGESSSSNYEVRAGFQQMQESYIALSGTSNVDLAPSIPGVSGGYSNGSTTVTVVTDASGGYELTIEAENSPAMQSGVNTIADYVPGGAAADYDFNIGAADAYFGFSPEGVDIVQAFLDDGGASCNEPAGTDTADTCWEGLSTTAQQIASDTGANHPAGATTTIKFRVGIGGSVVQPVGSYVATTTITAISL
tara:strand:+ start:686 stop:1462 length:777 start_codon:yes stop_codon:yes gene_type:complete